MDDNSSHIRSSGSYDYNAAKNGYELLLNNKGIDKGLEFKHHGTMAARILEAAHRAGIGSGAVYLGKNEKGKKIWVERKEIVNWSGVAVQRAINVKGVLGMEQNESKLTPLRLEDLEGLNARTAIRKFISEPSINNHMDRVYSDKQKTTLKPPDYDFFASQDVHRDLGALKAIDYSFNMKYPFQVSVLNHVLKVKFFDKVAVFAKKHPTVARISSPLVGITSALITVVSRTLSIIERITKGIICLCSWEGTFAGINFLFALYETAKLLTITPVKALFDILGTTFLMALGDKVGDAIATRTVKILGGGSAPICSIDGPAFYPIARREGNWDKLFSEKNINPAILKKKI